MQPAALELLADPSLPESVFAAMNLISDPSVSSAMIDWAAGRGLDHEAAAALFSPSADEEIA